MYEDLAGLAVRLAGELGCSYAEARVRRVRSLGVSLKNGEVEPARVYDGLGMGIRVVYEGALAFSSINRMERGAVREAVERLVKRAKSVKRAKKVGMSDEKMERARWGAEEREKLDRMGLEEMLKLLKELDGEVKGGFAGVEIPSRLLELEKEVEDRYLVNSDGAELWGHLPRVSFSSFLLLKLDGGFRSLTIPTGYSHPGGTGGWEVVKGWDLHSYLPDRVSKVCKHLKKAKGLEEGVMDVVIGPSIAGIVAHEACGHPSEADRILGREAAQAGESFLKPEDLGSRVGNEEANVSDDPTLKGSSGFYLYDDEGVRARKRELIKDGVVNEFLQNRETAWEFGLGSNASARAESFSSEPIVRMANTYVEPGDHSLEELVEGVKDGVLIESYMEWNIDDVRVNQRYVGLECYRIRNGRIGEELKDVVLELKSTDFWSKIDARGKELEFLSAYCGKGDPIQSVPVWTGGPYLRLKGVRVMSR
ncbi:MAG: TldD/PmbA family protein [Thaumarchaeota archaeon]|nr:TldD/PmbA family protein [Nitrososphaerota archaeon]